MPLQDTTKSIKTSRQSRPDALLQKDMFMRITVSPRDSWQLVDRKLLILDASHARQFSSRSSHMHHLSPKSCQLPLHPNFYVSTLADSSTSKPPKASVRASCLPLPLSWVGCLHRPCRRQPRPCSPSRTRCTSSWACGSCRFRRAPVPG